MLPIPRRYDYLHQAVRDKQPKAILEVGTWNGMRAAAMLNLCPTAKYYGFDVFEDVPPGLDETEKNAKAHHTIQAVYERLTGFDATLYKGNTRDTLKNFNEPVDFVWIDGGHSVETIHSDWENVKRCLMPDAWVFFDDYFTGGIDTTKYGCNEIVKDLKHEVHPHKDVVKGGGWTQMVRVWP